MISDSLSIIILISLLDSNSFYTRESAQTSLEKMGTIALPQLVLVGKQRCSPEQSLRIRRLLDRQTRVIIDLMCGNDVPFIDSIPYGGFDGFCLANDRWDIIGHYYSIVRGSTELWPRVEKEVKPYQDYKLAAKIWFEDLWLKGKSVEDMAKLLKVMRERSKYYVEHQMNWPD